MKLEHGFFLKTPVPFYFVGSSKDDSDKWREKFIKLGASKMDNKEARVMCLFPFVNSKGANTT